jgi:hypothetical protein
MTWLDVVIPAAAFLSGLVLGAYLLHSALLRAFNPGDW